ncbi:hypothetical protein CPB84DRAFT_1035813 [Gymnopilus junonius]|uniref:Uncharacterized protein n=1 Tax=Gymnopilus junonius TaxID=109634 RepID=A0A9P5NKP5_GYMJU|nr:hypothetical protein CPB84DRAFT_1035813 [Gymnopilus junonius]
MSALQSGWAPRRDLALPNELLYKVILLVISDSVHAICVSAEDTTWETNVLDTLVRFLLSSRRSRARLQPGHLIFLRVSRKTTRLIAYCAQNLRLPTPTRNEAQASLGMGRRVLRDNSLLNLFLSIWLCSISELYVLRRNSNRSPREVFESTHKVILSALGQSEALCDRVSPVEMSFRLKTSIEQEFELARHGLTLVQSFHELQEHANAMAILRPLSETDGTGPLAGLRSMIHNSLSKIEAAHEKYASAFSGKFLETELRMHELPGVQTALRSIYVLQYDEDEYDLQLRVQKIVDLWKGNALS